MFLRTLAALLLILSAAPALAQTDDDLPGPRECLDDDHTNRCDPEVQARVRERLGVASIEDEAASGAIVYRALFVNGYGNDMPAVAFERRPGQSPEVVIYGFDGRSTRAPVSHEAWEQVVDQARIADRVMEPLPPRADGAIAICAHAWVQTVEIANVPRERFGDETVRRRTESACRGGLTTRFAFFLVDLAIEQIPWCHRLDGHGQRNGVTRAATCLMLSGDRLAAANLYNARLADMDWMWRDPLDAAALRSGFGFGTSFTLFWDGGIVPNGSWHENTAGAFLAARLAELGSTRFWPRTVEASTPDHVTVRGVAEATPEQTPLQADYVQTWVFDQHGLYWRLAELTVGPFTPRADS